MLARSTTRKPGQLELGIARSPEADRNRQKGGRSFYFFDLDDNVFYLFTPIFIFHKKTGAEVALSTAEYARHHQQVGKTGPYQDHTFDFCPTSGSFRRFRDVETTTIRKILGRGQPLVEDIQAALKRPDYSWKGPSWNFFYHATFNRRPLSIITARGHSPETIRNGIEVLVKTQHLAASPNYLGVFPVSHPPTRTDLGDPKEKWSIAELKREAICQSVEAAMQEYGENPHHRFGMSDDDPKNIELIIEAMRNLKDRYPENSFFVIRSDKQPIVKQEVFLDRIEASPFPSMQQLHLFS